MTASNRRIHPRPYFFEWFTLANLVLAIVFLRADRGFEVATNVNLAVNLVIHTCVSVAIRGAVARYRGEREYFRIVRSIGWITDTLRIIISATLVVFVYGWIKLVVPLHHPRLFDQELWNLDQTMLFGVSPNILVLDLFSNRALLRVIDWSYAYIFVASFVILMGYFLAEPSRRLRVAFTSGNSLMWIAGAWLYLLIPSLGPAYRFPDVYFAYADALKRTQYLQALLMRNYQNVIRVASHRPATAPISIMFGIGAFPSLHVGLQTFAFFWMRKLWTAGEVLFAIFVFVILLGSLMTGWHYLIDGLAGFALGWLAYTVFARRARVDRWLTLRK
ncbi:MAG TPA: phosphatase PAP2 family protein [Thermoanaerobaculia bacterium]